MDNPQQQVFITVKGDCIFLRLSLSLSLSPCRRFNLYPQPQYIAVYIYAGKAICAVRPVRVCVIHYIVYVRVRYI